MIWRRFIFNHFVLKFLEHERQQSQTSYPESVLGPKLIELRQLNVIVSYSEQDARLQAIVLPSESVREQAPFMVTPFDCLVFAMKQDWDLLFRMDGPVRNFKDLRAALEGYSESFALIRSASESVARLQQIVDEHAGHQSAWEDEPNSPDFPASR